MDVKNCGARYLCEIGALAAEQRTIQEEAALSLFQVTTIKSLNSNTFLTFACMVKYPCSLHIFCSTVLTQFLQNY